MRLAFLAAALNDIDILAADIQNAYLLAPTKEKLYCIVGQEFGSDAGRPAKIVRALYGLRSSGKMFREHLTLTLREDMKFFSCKADLTYGCAKQPSQMGHSTGSAYSAT